MLPSRHWLKAGHVNGNEKACYLVNVMFPGTLRKLISDWPTFIQSTYAATWQPVPN